MQGKGFQGNVKDQSHRKQSSEKMPRILHASIAMQHIRCNCVSFAYFWINLNIDWSLIDVDQSSNAHCRLSTFNSYWTLNIEPPNAMCHRMDDQHATHIQWYKLHLNPPWRIVLGWWCLFLLHHINHTLGPFIPQSSSLVDTQMIWITTRTPERQLPNEMANVTRKI